jgi:predicted alpha/beta hydrolase family esterase
MVQTIMGTSNRPLLPRQAAPQVRVLIIPGLRDSGPAHWQSWLQTQYWDAVRVQQANWHAPDVNTWAAEIGRTIEGHGPDIHWVAVAHSFGCLALTHYLAQRTIKQEVTKVVSALLVAPADPVKFQLCDQLPQRNLGVPSLLIGSENDPWMPLPRAREWARHWGSRFYNLGQVGHINTESGFGPWLLARVKVDQMIRLQQLALRQGTNPELRRVAHPGGSPSPFSLGGLSFACDAPVP